MGGQMNMTKILYVDDSIIKQPIMYNIVQEKILNITKYLLYAVNKINNYKNC